MPHNYLPNYTINAHYATNNSDALYVAGYLILFIGFMLVICFIVLLIIDLGQPDRTEQSQAKPIPTQAFGNGSHHDFSWYFEGQSHVAISSIDDICHWLRECEYIHDRVLFLKEDFWQHPITFEQLRKGDCEDHALWAWRKLKELGIPAEFIVGHANPAGYHAWVVFELRGQQYLLETTQKSGLMIYPLQRTKRFYKPEVGVDHGLRVYRYV